MSQNRRMLAELQQYDWVIQAQGGAGSLGIKLIGKIDGLKARLAQCSNAGEYAQLSRQLGELQREHQALLEEGGQGRLL